MSKVSVTEKLSNLQRHQRNIKTIEYVKRAVEGIIHSLETSQYSRYDMVNFIDLQKYIKTVGPVSYIMQQCVKNCSMSTEQVLQQCMQHWSKTYEAIQKTIEEKFETKDNIIKHLKTNLALVNYAKLLIDQEGAKIKQSFSEKSEEVVEYLEYFSDGHVSSRMVVSSKLSTLTSWYPKGAFKHFFSVENGKLHGCQLSWYPNGQLMYKKFYTTGTLNEDFTWYSNGKPKSTKTRDCKNNTVESFYWYESGSLKRSETINELSKEITVSGWYENGMRESKKHLINGKFEEEQIQWWDDGKLMIREFYKDGKREGQKLVWRKNGQLSSKRFFKEGEMEGDQTWLRENGQIYAKGFYKDGKCCKQDCRD